MKKYVSIILTTLLSMGIIVSCKKDSTPKDYTASIIDKNWWGMLTYTGEPEEYYSVHFNTDKSLLWSQRSGDYPGQWVVNGNQLTMSFPGIGSEIKANISDNDKLTNISDDNSTFTINTGELILNPNISIYNTTWEGSFDVFTTIYPLQFTIVPGFNVEGTVGTHSFGPYPYTRAVSGGSIRFNLGGLYIFFGVIISGSEMKGSINGFPWQAIKQ